MLTRNENTTSAVPSKKDLSQSSIFFFLLFRNFIHLIIPCRNRFCNTGETIFSKKLHALRTAGHESYHWPEEKAPESAEKLRRFVVEHYVKEGKYESLAQRYAAQGYDGMDIDSELTADNLFDVMTQEGFLKKVARQDAGAVRSIRNTLSTFIRHMNKVLSRLTMTNPIHREIYNSLNSDKRFAEKLRRMFTDALESAKNENNKPAAKRSKEKTERAEIIKMLRTVTSSGLRNSIKPASSISDTKYSLRPGAAEDVRRALNSKNYTEDVYLTDTTPSIIVSQKGAKNLPMLMSARHIRENVFTEDQARKRGLRISKDINYHGLGETLFLDVISDLENVTLAYRGTKKAADPSRRENYFLLISQHKDEAGNTINVPVFINQKGQYNRMFMDTNKVATVFGRTDLQGYIQKEIAAGNLVRIKNRSDQAGELSPPIRHSYGEIASVNSISRGQAESQDKLSQKPVSNISEENRRLIEENEKYKARIMSLFGA